jgi:type II secretory pathway component GspD/PulD (secretin)
MPSHRRLPLTPMMLALALPWAIIPAGAAEAGGENPPPNVTASEASLAAQAAYAEAYAQYRKAAFAEAKDKIDEAVRLDPANADAQRLREDILAVLSQRDNRVQMAATWSKTLQDVRTQETAVRVGSLIADGDAKMAAGDYAGAESDYDRAEVAMRSFPFPFPWGELPAQVSGKRVAARAQARTQENDRAAKARSEAGERARAQAELQQQALANKVDELLRRAKDAYDRKDFKRAEVDAWNAYELDRRREDARSLYLSARREGHQLFDEKHEDERLDRVARVSEEIHKSLIPQSELLVYPEDWKRRALRKPREIGVGKEEPWMAAMKDRLEQRVTFEFQDTPFEDVVGFLRQVTGVNIIVAPTVIAANGGGSVTLKVRDMRFGDALKWILELTSLKMALQDQAIFVSNEVITGSVALRMYDVTDLIQQARDMPGREMAYSSGSGGDGAGGGIDLFQKDNSSDVKPPDPDELVEFIKKNVAPDNWDEATGHGIEQRAGSTLFISHVPEVHAQIEQLLSSLRNQQSLQVNMDVRLLDVRKNFFEEIGVDWLNSQTGSPPTSNSLVQSNSSDGYTRQNNNSVFNGSNNNILPSSQNTELWSSTSPISPRGLRLEMSHSPFNFIGTDQLNAVLIAAQTEGDGQTLEHPSLTCFNGQRASASFMNQYAYISDYEVVSSNLDPKITVLTFGNIIDMRPVVSSDRKYITLEVRPSSVQLQGVFTEFLEAPRIFDAAGGGGGNNTTVITPAVSYPLEMPNVLVKTLRSTILLPDKASLLIGGFQRSLRENTNSGIPFLSHIPFLGRLFSRNGTYDEDRRLFYLLHAEILDLNEKEALQ